MKDLVALIQVPWGANYIEKPVEIVEKREDAVLNGQRGGFEECH